MKSSLVSHALRGGWSLCLALGLAACPADTTLEVGACRVTDGFAAPESAAFDEHSRSWFVSNGGARGPGDGFISRLDASGTIVKREFAVGLDDPTGIALRDGTLYVADRTGLAIIDSSAPENIRRVAIPDAQFLNDVALDPHGTDVFVSDTFADRVYRVRGDAVETLITGGLLHAPNGLCYRDGTLWIATMGPDLDPMTFQTSAPGSLLRVDLNGAMKLEVVRSAVGSLDGLAAIGGGFLVSDTFRGVDFVPERGAVRPLLDAQTSSLSSWADIGIGQSGRQLAIPDLFSTRVAFCDLD